VRVRAVPGARSACDARCRYMRTTHALGKGTPVGSELCVARRLPRAGEEVWPRPSQGRDARNLADRAPGTARTANGRRDPRPLRPAPWGRAIDRARARAMLRPGPMRPGRDEGNTHVTEEPLHPRSPRPGVQCPTADPLPTHSGPRQRYPQSFSTPKDVDANPPGPLLRLLTPRFPTRRAEGMGKGNPPHRASHAVKMEGAALFRRVARAGGGRRGRRVMSVRGLGKA
jgi:hypothetical protein